MSSTEGVTHGSHRWIDIRRLQRDGLDERPSETTIQAPDIGVQGKERVVTRIEGSFETIVVALDASKDAEAILPYVETLPRAFNSAVTFVRALVPVEGTRSGELMFNVPFMDATTLESVYENHDAIGKEGASYLATMTKTWTARGFHVACEEPEMRAAEAIVKVAREKGAALIALTTPVRNGIPHPALGRVADEVVRTAPCPVLLVRPE